jgi:hypothetical protein
MARQQGSRTGRTRGSWTPRIVGIGAVVLIAGGGSAAYVIGTQAPAAPHPPQLPTRVQSVQTVGIVGQVPGDSGHGAAPRLLTRSGGGLSFDPIPASELAAGNPEWTADTMAGGTLVFIYAPDGKCLASTGRRRAPALSVQRCDLGRDQRWRRVNGTVESGGHQYGQYRNLDSGRCLATSGISGSLAALVPCDPAAPTSQLVSFWWAA